MNINDVASERRLPTLSNGALDCLFGAVAIIVLWGFSTILYWLSSQGGCNGSEPPNNTDGWGFNDCYTLWDTIRLQGEWLKDKWEWVKTLEIW